MKPGMGDIPVFRKSVQTLYGWEISLDEPLPYSTLALWIKKIGVLTTFPQVGLRMDWIGLDKSLNPIHIHIFQAHQSFKV